MTKILGLDMGTNSIGWAIIDKDQSRILDAGVRVFPAGVKDIGKGESEQSKNAERREHRMSRRLHFRKRLRKIKLLGVLINHQMCPLSKENLRKWKNWDPSEKSEGRAFPSEPAFTEWLKMNPYHLRDKALREPITRKEFGRILYHFIQRRGFLSTRKGKDDGAIYKGKGELQGINQTEELIEGKTLGQQLNKFLPKERVSYKRIHDSNGNEVRVRARYTLRRMYIEEFEKIWEKQAANLGLTDLWVTDTKTIFLKGSGNSSRNQHKISHLKEKHGEENLKVENNRVIVQFQEPFKEYIAGDIEHTEEGVKFKSNESVLFWQRPLRSQKSLLGKCTFESRNFYDKKTGKTRTIGASPAPLSHPDFELFRAYQFVNNIRFGSRGFPLNDVQRETVLEEINKHDGLFDFKKIPAALDLSYEKFNYDDSFKVAGNKTHKQLKALFTAEQWEKFRYDIWHCFHFYDDPDLLAEKLANTYGLNEKNAKRAGKLQLKEGYGSVSLKAIRNILPFLEMGFPYSTAVVLGGVKNAFGQRWEHFKEFHNEIIQAVESLINNKDKKKYELISEIKAYLANPDNNFGFQENDKAFRRLYHHSQDIEKKNLKRRLSEIENLRNPIVQKGLNEMRRLVNELLDTYSAPSHYGPGFGFDKIHVELGRDLRSGKNQRQEMMFKISQNEKANEEARARLAEFGLKPGRENITKYRLFKEIEEKHTHAVCPYTNKAIKISDVLGQDNRIQIEHIIPHSVSLDDSFQNKTLCEANFNRLKGELTPYAFYQKNSDPALWGANSWDEIEQRAYALLPYGKARKFTRKVKPDTSDFIERQLNDTRYMSKKAAGILTEICDDVRVLPGQLTSELRRLWGLNNVIQPIEPLDLKGYNVDAHRGLPHYVVIDEQGAAKAIQPVLAERPETTANQLLIPGEIDKNKFFPTINEPFLQLDIEATDLPKGKYWAKINVSDPIRFVKKYNERPPTDECSIAYRGRVSKGQFAHNSLPKKIKTDLADGSYWVKLSVKQKTFVRPEKRQKPNTKANQVLLFGEIKNNWFSSYIYACEAGLDPGQYWAKLDVDYESAEFIPAFNRPGIHSNNEFIIEGNIDNKGVFAAEADMHYQKKTTQESGKYFAVVHLLSAGGFCPVHNQPPPKKKGETIVEGTVWANKQTGEIMFDPVKSRDDHRHHAVDAITVAFTNQGYLNELSRYFGVYKEKERGIGERPTFALPWPNFHNDVKQAVDQILVSHHRNDRIVSKISKTIEKNGRTFKSEGFAARGQLHREFYFGKHKGKPQNLDAKNGVFVDKNEQGNPEYYYHRRKSLAEIKDHKHVNKIADPGIRELIHQRLRNDFGIDPSGTYKIPDGFFFDKEKRPALFLPNKKGDPVPVKKVRMRERVGNAVQLKSDLNQWVNPYNNHHVVIYLDREETLQEQVVSFWEVVERIHQGEPVYKLPEDGRQLIATLQENDMFLLGLSRDQEQALKENRLPGPVISQHLYRVQKLSSMYYTFRHHLVSGVDTDKGEVRIVSMKAWKNTKPIKVQIDLSGQLQIV